MNEFLEIFNSLDPNVQQTALTHSSYANEYKTDSNERLEFLGDSVLSLIVGQYLFEHIKTNEGKMSKLRSNLVCWQNLYKCAEVLNIKDRLRIGHSILSVSESMLADAVESMIGAMYLNVGLKKTTKAVINLLDLPNYVKSNPKAQDYKSDLQELCQKLKYKLVYDSAEFENKGGQITFRSDIYLDSVHRGYGQGSTKREAEQNAAKIVLQKLSKEYV